MNCLGIDFGTKNIGLAVSFSGLSEPLAVIRVGKKDHPLKKDSPLVKKIRNYCHQYQVERLVVGLPEGKLTGLINKFGGQLEKLVGLPVFYQDETLTSQEAVGKMLSSGRGKKFRQVQQDAVAAAIILQNYIDFNV